MSSQLYIVGSPIGNLGDITLRALETLRGVDAIYAEDTRVSGKLLARYEIKKPLHSFREAAPKAQVDWMLEKIIQQLQGGQSLAYLSDAGTPGISDPGQYLVQKVVEAGYSVVPIPGPSALASLLSVAGLPIQRVLFIGFLPKKKGHSTQMKALASMLQEGLCDGVILYESPERILKLVAEISAWELGVELCLGRELTKRFEELIRGTPEEVTTLLKAKADIKGEISLLISRSI